MTFSVLKTYPVLPSTSRTPFSSNEFLSFFGKLYFRIFAPLLLHSSQCTPSIEPQPAKFLHTVCQRFCQPSKPCSDPCFSFVQWTVARGGGGVKCEEGGSVFNHEFSLIGPPKLILFNPFHCYKNPFTLLEITIGQDKIYS